MLEPFHLIAHADRILVNVLVVIERLPLNIFEIPTSSSLTTFMRFSSFPILASIAWLVLLLVSLSNGFERPTTNVKPIENALKTSKYLSETKILNSEDKVKLIFQTGDMKTLTDVIITVNLFQIDANTKYNYIGNLVIFDAIASKSEYSVEFTPPFFLDSGDYLVTSSLIKEPYRTEFPLDVTQAKFAIRRANVPNFARRQEGGDVEPRPVEGGIAEATFSNPTALRNILNSLSTVSEVCNLCTTTKAVLSRCDEIFKIPYPVRSISIIALPPKNHKPITTKLLCTVALAESKIYQVGFKNLDKVVFRTLTLGHPIADIKADARSGNHKNLDYTIWAHPLIEKYYNRYLQVVLGPIFMSFYSFFNPFAQNKIAFSKKYMSKFMPWNEMIEGMHRILETTTSPHYYALFADQVKVQSDTTAFTINWFPYMAGLVIPKSNLRPDVISIFEEWDEATLAEREYVMRTIGRW
ncbi:hypothetical protein BKA69DRAFT_1124225 [Paraphysoderma sedebokerense]|nr:hypothetical protein BKA69DRAFT_1124225 [Paraphysoderma sedebokerense]